MTRKAIVVCLVVILMAVCCGCGAADVNSQTLPTITDHTDIPTPQATNVLPAETSSNETILPATTPVSQSIERIALDPVQEKQEYHEGMYKVGVDIPASIYWFFAYDGAAISSATVKSSSSSDAEVLVVDVIENFSLLGVKEGEYLDACGCMFVELGHLKGYLDAMMQELGHDYFIPGMYLGGFSIRPGEYKAVVQENANISSIVIYSDPYQQEVKDIQIIQNQSYITIQSGEYIKVAGANLYPLDYDLQ